MIYSLEQLDYEYQLAHADAEHLRDVGRDPEWLLARCAADAVYWGDAISTAAALELKRREALDS